MSSTAANVAAVPTLLIALGTLFLLDYRLGAHFSKTWPAVLILAGLLRLMGWGRR